MSLSSSVHPTPTTARYKGFVSGYPRMAQEMSVYPELAQFRRFGALNNRNLMYLQNDLANLERALKEAENEDNMDPRGRKRLYARDFHCTDVSITDDADARQRTLILRIREKLKEYNEALYLQATIYNLKRPEESDIEEMQRFQDDLGSPLLLGANCYSWGTINKKKSYPHDLITLRPREKMDRFSKVMPGLVYELLWRWIPKFQRKSPDESNLAYNDAVVLRYTFWFTAFVAALLPLVSLAILTYCALSQGAQIAVIGAFTSLAALCLAWLTEADRKDIFLITSMFAAVQVIFAGAHLGKTGYKPNNFKRFQPQTGVL